MQSDRYNVCKSCGGGVNPLCVYQKFTSTIRYSPFEVFQIVVCTGSSQCTNTQEHQYSVAVQFACEL